MTALSRGAAVDAVCGANGETNRALQLQEEEWVGLETVPTVVSPSGLGLQVDSLYTGDRRVWMLPHEAVERGWVQVVHDLLVREGTLKAPDLWPSG